MGRTRRLHIALSAALAGIAVPAEACRFERPLPTREEAAAAKEPRFGLVGKIMATFAMDKAGSDQSIVQVDVTEDFSGKLPSVMYVLNPGCCMCMGIGGKRGDQVITIVERRDDGGLFHLAY